MGPIASNLSAVVLGPLLRKSLEGSPGFVRWLTNTYRGFFVDLQRVVDCLPVEPHSATLLNVGTGDGVLVSMIARRFPQLTVTSTDITANQGWLIEPDLRDSISLQVHTPEQIAETGFGTGFDLVVMSDVIHHVPISDRARVMARAWQATAPGGCLVVKDIEERGYRARLSLWSDRYITGDRHTELIGSAAMDALMRQEMPEAQVQATTLIERDYPNYLLIGRRVGSRVESRPREVYHR